uniref:BED-type domain-containing protein n=1 Tax=Timema douglasi TaxID=61478 RepID=A0A7R8V9P9_TIMDO|nr:unnamed protein product [Timema douglasi]
MMMHRKRSCVWNYFEEVLGDKVICRSCNHILTNKAKNTTHMLKHLQRVHGLSRPEPPCLLPLEESSAGNNEHDNDITQSFQLKRYSGASRNPQHNGISSQSIFTICKEEPLSQDEESMELTFVETPETDKDLSLWNENTEISNRTTQEHPKDVSPRKDTRINDAVRDSPSNKEYSHEQRHCRNNSKQSNDASSPERLEVTQPSRTGGIFSRFHLKKMHSDRRFESVHVKRVYSRRGKRHRNRSSRDDSPSDEAPGGPGRKERDLKISEIEGRIQQTKAHIIQEKELHDLRMLELKQRLDIASPCPSVTWISYSRQDTSISKLLLAGEHSNIAPLESCADCSEHPVPSLSFLLTTMTWGTFTTLPRSGS